MPRRIESLMLDGPAGKLEAILEEPEDREPARAVLVCHPHPQHGGTMHNKVVYRLARGFRRSGCVVLRFNYRGVNLSEGSYDHGNGELEDARAALTVLRERYPALPFSLAGFSFGSRIILRLGCTLPDVEKLIAVGFPSTYKDRSYLEDCAKDRTFIHSTNDQFGSVPEMKAIFDELPEPKRLVWVTAEDHFFRGALDEFENSVAQVF